MKNNDKTRQWNAEDFKIIAFFAYTTYSFDNDKISEEVDPAWDRLEYEYRSNHTVRKCFEELLKRAEKIAGRRLNDNKIAIEAKDADGNILYFGQKDWKWYVSTAVQGDHRRLEINEP